MAASMTQAAIVQRSESLLCTFEGEPQMRERLLGSKKRAAIFEDAVARGAEVVVLTASERLVKQHHDELRNPAVRVIMLSDERLSDQRLDTFIYAYLPLETPPALVDRMIENAFDHLHVHATRRKAFERLNNVNNEIQELNRIGVALSAEHDTERLLEVILTKARQITGSDAGSLYLLERGPSEGSMVDEQGAEERRSLRFKLAQNDSVHIPFREVLIPVDKTSIAGYVAMTGETVQIEDAYRLAAGVPYKINRSFDEDSGYRTKSILAVPMRNAKDETVGVLQLINAKHQAAAKLDSVTAVKQYVMPFTQRQQEIVVSLASQAAVALENSRLYEAIQQLFEGFVRAAVVAIESRDPTTSGHSFRVANLTVALAEAVDRCDSGPHAETKFTRTQLREIRYASLLHDFGKVGVREEVLVKAKKLYPAQLELIKQRFHYVKRSMEAASLRAQLKTALESGREEYLGKKGEFDRHLAAQYRELNGYFETVLQADEPTVLAQGNFEKLLDIAARRFEDADGEEAPLLTEDEVRLLSIRKGSLDDAEREQIESHVVHTYKFLQQIPWTPEIRHIPEIARGHHEKLNGTGYPYKLSAPEIPVQTRMMTISDIFDALSAADRPYKKAVSLEHALEILGFAVKDGELDPELFGIFKDAKVFERWKVEPVAY